MGTKKEDSCALCKKKSKLSESHIIPRFVSDWMKKTSATGRIRRSEIPNLRVQDGYKIPLVCKDCENLFGVWEKYFAEEIFLPLHKNSESEVSYGPWLEKFVVSESWRVGIFFKNMGWLSHLPRKFIDAIDRALKTLNDFLLDNRPDPGQFEQHLLPLDAIQYYKDTDMLANINRYLLRAVDINIGYTKTEIYTYAKICHILLIGFIKILRPEQWRGTKLQVDKGIVGGQKHYQLPVGLWDFMKDRARNAARAYASMSKRQKDRIAEDYRKKELDEIVKSESFRALHEDVLLFGNGAFEEPGE